METQKNSTVCLSYRNIQVVAAILVQQIHGKIRVLAQKRPKQKEFEEQWEFPGGKLEQNETIEDALVRELKEELGIEITAWKFWTKMSHFYEQKNLQVELFFFFVTKFPDEPLPQENQTIVWLELPEQEEELKKLPFLEADRHIVSLLPSYDYSQLELT